MKKLRRLVKNTVPFWVIERLYYHKEFKLYNNKGQGKSDAPSILFFTLQKCASTFTPNLLAYLNQKYLNHTCVSLAGYIFDKTPRTVNEVAAERPWMFQPKGYMYAPLRYALELDHQDSYVNLLMVRDPRDITTSQFFSTGYSHSVPIEAERRKAFLQTRGQVQRMTIDEYVESRIPKLVKQLTAYMEMAERHPVTILKYEDMVTDFNRFMDMLGQGLGIEIPEQDRKVLFEMGGFGTQATQSIHAHRRNVTPGDHRKKLQPETIAKLNDAYSPILEYFNYEL